MLSPIRTAESAAALRRGSDVHTDDFLKARRPISELGDQAVSRSVRRCALYRLILEDRDAVNGSSAKYPVFSFPHLRSVNADPRHQLRRSRSEVMLLPGRGVSFLAGCLSMSRDEATAREPIPLAQQRMSAAHGEQQPDIQEAEHCQWCRTFTVSCCRTMMDVRSCRNLDEDEGLTPVALVPIACAQ